MPVSMVKYSEQLTGAMYYPAAQTLPHHLEAGTLTVRLQPQLYEAAFSENSDNLHMKSLKQIHRLHCVLLYLHTPKPTHTQR